MSKFASLCFMVLTMSATVSAFLTNPSVHSHLRPPKSNMLQLNERRWNFNEGRAPWGLAKNAEIWNGRVAQVAFTLTFMQELVQGKGVFQGLQEGDPVNIAFFGLAGISIVGLTAFLALKGDDDFTVDA